MNITEKVSYIKGLMEGLAIDESKPENKLIKAIVEALNDIASEVADMGVELERVDGYLDELDYDLGELENDYYYVNEDDDYDYADDCDCDCDCDCCDEDDCDCCDEDDCDCCHE